MENLAPTEPAALAERTLRLRALADQLLLALEATELPKDATSIARMARAVLTLDRLIKALYAGNKAAAKPVDEALPPLPEPAQMPEPAPLNRRDRRRLEAELRKAA